MGLIPARSLAHLLSSSGLGALYAFCAGNGGYSGNFFSESWNPADHVSGDVTVNGIAAEKLVAVARRIEKIDEICILRRQRRWKIMIVRG
jgi:hypothetical protein